MSKAELFFEIGSEEIPAAEVMMAAASVRSTVVTGLNELRLSHGDPQVYATPRRLALVVPDVDICQEDRTNEVSGPPAKVAFKDGQPTKAAEGFAKGLGLTVGDLTLRETPKGEYLFAVVEEKGQDAKALLPELLIKAIKDIPFRRTMRWGNETEAFVRPIQWLVALFGGEVLDVRYADVTAGRTTFGHRFMAPEAVEIDGADQYVGEMAERDVVIDVDERRRRIVEAATALAAKVGGKIREDEGLIDEVVQLVENPIAMMTQFDPRFLEIPDEVLISEMREHQRYLSVVDAEGKLTTHFVVIGNTRIKDEARVLDGYRRVLSARFEDGSFFYREDQKRKLHDRVEDLKKVQFHRALGSIHEKVERNARMARVVAEQLGAQLEKVTGEAGLAKLERASFLAKADLTTHMVFEFPELQGVMGRAYAEIDGEAGDVALAVEEHYMPKNAGDDLPKGELGALVGIGDRLDTIAGIFSVGKGPTGAADPFGLRRAALAIITILRDRGWHVSLDRLVHESVKGLEDKRKKKTREEVEDEVREFFRGRLRGVLTSQDVVPSDVAEAVLSAGYDDVVDVGGRAEALASLRKTPDFEPLAVTFKRVANILKKDAPGELNPALLQEPAEQALLAAADETKGVVKAALEKRDFQAAFKAVAELRPTVDKLFDEVMVNAEDPGLKAARLALVDRVQQLFAPLADFTKLS